MITGFYDKRDFFKNSTENTVFIYNFNLLYQYKAFLIKRFKYWLGFERMLERKKFEHFVCRMFVSERYKGELLVLGSCTIAPDPRFQNEIDERLKNLKKWIDNLELYSEKQIYRIDLNSFTLAYSSKNFYKFLDMLASSTKEFHVFF